MGSSLGKEGPLSSFFISFSFACFFFLFFPISFLKVGVFCSHLFIPVPVVRIYDVLSLWNLHGSPQRCLPCAGTGLTRYIIIQVWALLSTFGRVCRVSRVHLQCVMRDVFFLKKKTNPLVLRFFFLKKNSPLGPNILGVTLDLWTWVRPWHALQALIFAFVSCFTFSFLALDSVYLTHLSWVH